MLEKNDVQRPFSLPVLGIGFGAAATPLAHYLGVDFHIVNTVVVLDEPYAGQFTRQELTGAEIDTLLRERNNVATEIHLTLRVRK